LWLTALVDIMEKDGTIGLAQCMILKIDGQEILTAGYLLDSYLQDAFALGENMPTISCLDSISEVSFASGAAMMARRELIDEVGLFDPKLPFFCDDTLLSLKTWLAGKRVVTVAGSKVCHVGGGTWKGDPQFLAYHILKGRISLIFATYRGFGELATALFTFTVCLFKNSISLLKSKNQAVFWANTRAMSWAFRNLKYMWGNRLRYWWKARVSPRNLIRNFIRLEIPASLYLLPSRSRMIYCEHKVKEYFKGTINQRNCHGVQTLTNV
jgi:GT2 family glycosyltransferase